MESLKTSSLTLRGKMEKGAYFKRALLVILRIRVLVSGY